MDARVRRSREWRSDWTQSAALVLSALGSPVAALAVLAAAIVAGLALADLPLWIQAGVGAALFLSVAGLFALRAQRRSIRSLERLDRQIGARAFGATPVASERLLRQLPPDRRSLHGLIAERPEGAYASALRATFDRISRAFGIGGQVVMVAPVQVEPAGENFTLQLAATAAAAGRRVLVVDGDLGRSKVSGLLGMDGPGLWDAICGAQPWRACVNQAEGLGFDVLSAGTSDRNTVREWYGDGRFAALLREMKAAYDVVLVDTPAALQGPDARMTAPLADVAVLIAPWGRTPVLAARRAVQAIADRAPHLRVGLAVTAMRSPARQAS